MDKELITVVVPVYNTELYLKRCVDSILNQTYKCLEILLVDDGSPDNSGVLCDEYADKDERIKVIHKKNGGLSSARNAGIDRASGKYISFIDSDDFIDKDMIERLYSVLNKHDADMSMVKYLEVTTDDTIKQEKEQEIVYAGKQVEYAFLNLKVDSVCVGLYRRDLIGDLRFIEGKTSEDIPFNFLIFQKAKKFVYIPEKRYYYYYNPKSISNGKLDANMLNYLEFRKEIYEYYSEKSDKQLRQMSSALYARAAMGLQARMALYGLDSELKEIQCVREFKKVFSENKTAFFLEKTIPLSRKITAIVVFYFYGLVRILRKKI